MRVLIAYSHCRYYALNLLLKVRYICWLIYCGSYGFGYFFTFIQNNFVGRHDMWLRLSIEIVNNISSTIPIETSEKLHMRVEIMQHRNSKPKLSSNHNPMNLWHISPFSSQLTCNISHNKNLWGAKVSRLKKIVVN